MKRVLLLIACTMVVCASALALGYSGYWGSPSESDIDEMSDVLQRAVRIINDLESRVDDLEYKISDLEYRISNIE